MKNMQLLVTAFIVLQVSINFMYRNKTDKLKQQITELKQRIEKLEYKQEGINLGGYKLK